MIFGFAQKKYSVPFGEGMYAKENEKLQKFQMIFYEWNADDAITILYMAKL